MTMEALNDLLPLLYCPQCRDNVLSAVEDSQELLCSACGARYPVIDGRPVLLHSSNQVFCIDDYRNAALPSLERSGFNWESLVPSPSLNLASERLLARLGQMLAGSLPMKVLVVGCGVQRQRLDVQLGAGDGVGVVYSDIDVRADVDLFCDGHDLPFCDGAFDAVVTTAVLEHVLYPEQVVGEIGRVLKTGGLLYSELPFMQQVHEGAYDFTRYTLSGHRRLFNGFEEIDCGMVAGPGTALVWAIENFALAFLAMPLMRKFGKVAVRFLFSWIKQFDRLLAGRSEAMDGASCTYFFGRKIDGRVPDTKIIASYVGAKHLRHA
jgi:uncharacterized protein YbaR (Trm112 family)